MSSAAMVPLEMKKVTLRQGSISQVISEALFTLACIHPYISRAGPAYPPESADVANAPCSHCATLGLNLGQVEARYRRAGAMV